MFKYHCVYCVVCDIMEQYTTVRLKIEDGNILEKMKEETGINKNRLVHNALKMKYPEWYEVKS